MTPRCHACGVRPLQADGLPARLLAELERVGEWLSAGALARTFGVPSSAAAGALRRLADRGLIHRLRVPSRRSARWAYRADRSQLPRSRSWPPTLTAGYLCSCGQFLPNPQRVPVEYILSAHRQEHLFGVAS